MPERDGGLLRDDQGRPILKNVAANAPKATSDVLMAGTLVDVDGKEIVTIEGIAASGDISATNARVTTLEGSQTTQDTNISVIKEGLISPSYPEYGGIGNDSADDTAALQSAINAGPTMIDRPYKITAPLTLPTGARLEQVGKTGHIRLAANSNTDGLRATPGTARVAIKGVVLIGPEDGTWASPNGANTARGIILDGVTDAVIEGMRVSRFWLQGMVVNAGARNKVLGNTVTEIKAGNGISVDAVATDTAIVGNTVKNVADCSIGLHNGTLGTTIVGNVLESTSYGRGVDVYGAPETVISGNVIRDTGVGTAAAAHGVWVAKGLGASDIPHRCVIAGNEMFTVRGDGIQAWGDVESNDLTITGNVIAGAGLVGIHLARRIVRSTITGNQVTNAGGHGIHFEEGGGLIPTTAVVSANHVRGCVGTGLIASAGVTGVTGAGNSLLGNGAIINVPSGNTVLYEDAAGYMRINGGLTATELYASAGLYPSGVLRHTGSTLGFYSATAIAKQTGVAVTAAGIHAALVNLGLIAA